MATNRTPRPQDATREIGQSGTYIFRGYLSQTDYNIKLTGRQGLDVYDQMRRGDATVRAALLAVTLPILAANWRIDPASDSAQDKEIAEFIHEQLWGNDVTFEEFLREALTYLPLGRYLFEIVYDFTPDGKVGLQKLAPRMPRTVLRWETEDGKPGITQMTPEGPIVSIPIEKLIIFVNDKEGDNWEGFSILRSAYKHWHMKETLEKIDVIAMERQGLGVPYAKPSTPVGPAEKLAAENVMQNLRADEQGYLYIEPGWEFGFVDMKAHSTRDPMKSIAHHTFQILLSVMAEFLSLGSGGSKGGAYALSADLSEFFVLALKHVANQVGATMDKYLIQRLVDFNYSVDKYPTLTYDGIGSVDFNAITTSLQRLAQIGNFTPDLETEQVLRKAMNLPEAPEDAVYPKPTTTNKPSEALPDGSTGDTIQPQPDAPAMPDNVKASFLSAFVESEAKALKEAVYELSREPR